MRRAWSSRPTSIGSRASSEGSWPPRATSWGKLVVSRRMGLALVGIGWVPLGRLPWPTMAGRGQKISVDLDADIVERTRSALGADAESDAAVVERALNA